MFEFSEPKQVLRFVSEAVLVAVTSFPKAGNASLGAQGDYLFCEQA